MKVVPADKAPPRELLLEATYSDPNGEVQTFAARDALARRGRRRHQDRGHGYRRQPVPVQALASTCGQAGAGVALNSRRRTAHVEFRKRMVGGFYTYDNKTEDKEIGTVCSGKSDDHGLFSCEANLKEAGKIELIAVAKDRTAATATQPRRCGSRAQDELWFGGENTDRIDVLPEKAQL